MCRLLPMNTGASLTGVSRSRTQPWAGTFRTMNPCRPIPRYFRPRTTRREIAPQNPAGRVSSRPVIRQDSKSRMFADVGERNQIADAIVGTGMERSCATGCGRIQNLKMRVPCRQCWRLSTRHSPGVLRFTRPYRAVVWYGMLLPNNVADARPKSWFERCEDPVLPAGVSALPVKLSTMATESSP